MKPKRKNQRKTTDLRRVDENSPAYWEEILARENLRMSRGSDARLIYVGGTASLTYVEAAQQGIPSAAEPSAE